MGRFRVIDTRIHNDAKFRALPMQSQWLIYHCLSHQDMTSLGAMRATLEGIAGETGEPLARIKEAFALVRIGAPHAGVVPLSFFGMGS